MANEWLGDLPQMRQGRLLVDVSVSRDTANDRYLLSVWRRGYLGDPGQTTQVELDGPIFRARYGRELIWLAEQRARALGVAVPLRLSGESL